jgi:hypothetical protein
MKRIEDYLGEVIERVCEGMTLTHTSLTYPRADAIRKIAVRTAMQKAKWDLEASGEYIVTNCNTYWSIQHLRSSIKEEEILSIEIKLDIHFNGPHLTKSARLALIDE